VTGFPGRRGKIVPDRSEGPCYCGFLPWLAPLSAHAVCALSLFFAVQAKSRKPKKSVGNSLKTDDIKVFSVSFENLFVFFRV
jgi:hypothetical protein